MTIVTNIDGTYHAHGAIDHCKHGRYVGGCGYDFMCGACEDGGPDMTLREAIARVDRLAQRYWEKWDKLVAIDAISADETFEAWFDEIGHGSLGDAVRERDWIAERCNGLDDDNYLARIHWAAIEAERIAAMLDQARSERRTVNEEIADELELDPEQARRLGVCPALTYERAVDIARKAGVEQEFIDDVTRTWQAIDWSGPVCDIADDLDFICELLDLSEFAPLMHDQYLHAGRLA